MRDRREGKVKQVMGLAENKRKDKEREGKRSKRMEGRQEKKRKEKAVEGQQRQYPVNVTAVTVVHCAVSRNCGA